jgi:hypothetical protein
VKTSHATKELVFLQKAAFRSKIQRKYDVHEAPRTLRMLLCKTRPGRFYLILKGPACIVNKNFFGQGMTGAGNQKEPVFFTINRIKVVGVYGRLGKTQVHFMFNNVSLTGIVGKRPYFHIKQRVGGDKIAKKMRRKKVPQAGQDPQAKTESGFFPERFKAGQDKIMPVDKRPGRFGKIGTEFRRLDSPCPANKQGNSQFFFQAADRRTQALLTDKKPLCGGGNVCLFKNSQEVDQAVCFQDLAPFQSGREEPGLFQCFPKTSVFGKVTLDLGCETPKPIPKPTKFSDWLFRYFFILQLLVNSTTITCGLRKKTVLHPQKSI